MAKVKVFVTDRQTEGRMDGRTDEWDLMSPRFRESGGQLAMVIIILLPKYQNNQQLGNIKVTILFVDYWAF